MDCRSDKHKSKHATPLAPLWLTCAVAIFCSAAPLPPPPPPAPTIPLARKAEARAYLHDVALDVVRSALIGSTGTVAVTLDLEFDERRFAQDLEQYAAEATFRASSLAKDEETRGKRLLAELSYIKPPPVREEYPLTPAEVATEPAPVVGETRFGKLNIDLDPGTMSRIVTTELKRMQEREGYLDEHRPVSLALQVGAGQTAALPAFTYDTLNYVANVSVAVGLPAGSPPGIDGTIRTRLMEHGELARFFKNAASDAVKIVPAADASSLGAPVTPGLAVIFAGTIIGLLMLGGAYMIKTALASRPSSQGVKAADDRPAARSEPSVEPAPRRVSPLGRTVATCAHKAVKLFVASATPSDAAQVLLALPDHVSRDLIAGLGSAITPKIMDQIAVRSSAAESPESPVHIERALQRLDRVVRQGGSAYDDALLRILSELPVQNEPGMATFLSFERPELRLKAIQTRAFVQDFTSLPEANLVDVLLRFSPGTIAALLAMADQETSQRVKAHLGRSKKGEVLVNASAGETTAEAAKKLDVVAPIIAAATAIFRGDAALCQRALADRGAGEDLGPAISVAS